MQLLESLNPTARRVATTLFRAYPKFADGFEALEKGHFEASIPAPHGSHAGALVGRTAQQNDIWVRLAPPQMWYSVDEDDELIRILDRILRDELLFARVVDETGAWVQTTLVHSTEDLDLDHGQIATFVSWSGKRDDSVASDRTDR